MSRERKRTFTEGTPRSYSDLNRFARDDGARALEEEPISDTALSENKQDDVLGASERVLDALK